MIAMFDEEKKGEKYESESRNFTYDFFRIITIL